MAPTSPRSLYRLKERMVLRMSTRDMAELKALAAAAEAPPATVARQLLRQALAAASHGVD